MSNRAEFLLARIAEDEAVAQRGWRDAHLGDCAAADLDYPMPCDCGHPARVLAECEAKRQIVDEVMGWYARAATAGGPDDDEILRLLALPYADHPNYAGVVPTATRS